MTTSESLFSWVSPGLLLESSQILHFSGYFIFSKLLGFLGGSVVKNLPANAGDLGSIPGLRSSPGGGNGNPLQCSCLENPHGQKSLAGYCPWVAKSWAQLSD